MCRYRHVAYINIAQVRQMQKLDVHLTASSLKTGQHIYCSKHFTVVGSWLLKTPELALSSVGIYMQHNSKDSFLHVDQVVSHYRNSYKKQINEI